MTAEIIAAPAAGLPQLSPRMQPYVDRTLAADRKGGEALWEKALACADARAAASAGEWGMFLEATGQHERAARRLIAIAERGRAEARFRDAIISGWLPFSVGAIAAQADDDLLTKLLDLPAPPTRQAVEALTARPDTGVRSLSAPPPAPTYSEIARERQQRMAARDAAHPDAVPPLPPPPLAEQIAAELDALDNRQASGLFDDDDRAALDTLDDDIEGLADTLGDAEYEALSRRLTDLQEWAPADAAPALLAFPPGPIEAGIGAIQARLRDGEQESGDLAWARELRTKLDAAQATTQPAVYHTWSERLDVVTDALIRLSAPEGAADCYVCPLCGNDGPQPTNGADMCDRCAALCAPPESTAPALPDVASILGPIGRKMLAARGWELTGNVQSPDNGDRIYELRTPETGSGRRNLVWKTREGITAIIRQAVTGTSEPTAAPDSDLYARIVAAHSVPDAVSSDAAQADDEPLGGYIEIEENDEITVSILADGLTQHAADAVALIADSLRLMARGESHAVETGGLMQLAALLNRDERGHARGTLATILTMIAEDADALATTQREAA